MAPNTDFIGEAVKMLHADAGRMAGYVQSSRLKCQDEI